MKKEVTLFMNDMIKGFIRRKFDNVVTYRLLEYMPYCVTKKIIEDGDTEGVAPQLFNKNGERMHIFYIADRNVRYSMIAGRTPRYILWNHNDTNLPVHFYSYRSIEEGIKNSTAKVKCLYIHESKAIIPAAYKYVLEHEEIANKFDYIFTSNADILNKYKNARFSPASGVWYGSEKWGGNWNKNRLCEKNKMISLLSSNKKRCELHKFRLSLANHYMKSDNVDTYGTFNRGGYVRLNDAFDDYRYSIVIENEQSPYYFTEKIMNCFASMTVPIYIGATKIGDFFNLDGIIQVESSTIESIEDAVRACSVEDYNNRKEAILDNYIRAQEYLCVEDYLYKHYKKELMLE